MGNTDTTEMIVKATSEMEPIGSWDFAASSVETSGRSFFQSYTRVFGSGTTPLGLERVKLPLDNVDTGRVNLSAAVQRCYDSKLWGESPWCDGSRRSVWQGPGSGSPDLMSEKVTIELPDELSRRARKLAAAGNRRLEDAVIDWINRAVSEPDVEVLPDDELLTTL